MPAASRPVRHVSLCTLLFAASPLAPGAQSHFISGPLENPVFVNDIVGTGLLWDSGYYGEGIVIANVEGGHVWSGHEVFDRSAINAALGTSLPASPAVLVNAPATVDAPELGEVDFHATMVGHVLVGATTVTNPDSSVSLTLAGAGMAPLATLWSGAIATHFAKTEENAGAFEITEESFRLPYVEFFTGATYGRADVINSSWGDDGTDSTVEYGGTDRAYETRTITGLAAQNPSVATVISAGNSGPGPDKVGSPALSLNVIAVGSLGGADFLTPSAFSSGGPVAFYNPATNQTIPAARQAVHVAAPGEDLTLAAYLQPTGGFEPLLTPETTTTDNNYYFLHVDGTSFSAPTVAGGIALLKNLIKANPAFFPQTEALDARTIRSVIMASALRTTGWNNGQAPGPGGALVTTQALDPLTGAGRFDVGRAAELLVVGTHDVPGLGGGTGLTATGWDFGSVSLGQVNDYTIDLSGFATPLEFTVSLNWFSDDHFDSLTGLNTYGSFADLNLEVWSVSIGGTYDTLLAASRSLYNSSELLRFDLSPGGSIGLRVTLDGMVYDFDGPLGADVGYGLAWASTAIPEPAAFSLHAGAAGLGFFLLRRRRRA